MSRLSYSTQIDSYPLLVLSNFMMKILAYVFPLSFSIWETRVAVIDLRVSSIQPGTSNRSCIDKLINVINDVLLHSRHQYKSMISCYFLPTPVVWNILTYVLCPLLVSIDHLEKESIIFSVLTPNKLLI